MLVRPLQEILNSGVVVVFDLEFTSWVGAKARQWGGDREYREIVQIGAVKLNAREGFDEVDSLTVLVRPVINPLISTYLRQLTGLEQTSIEAEGLDFASALMRFSKFVGTDTEAILSFGGDAMVLHENCGLNRMTCPLRTDLFFDVKPMICDWLTLDLNTESADLALLLGSEMGLRHNALDDARNVAAAIRFHLWKRSPPPISTI
ncbi:MAG: 3'-5' exonuclease [Pirellulales bacterium]